MAGPFVSLVFDAVRDVSPGEKLTLLSLADRANRADGGRAWPSVADIAARTNRQERQVRSDLRVLERHRWIEQVERGGGWKKAAVYRLNFERMLLSLEQEKAAVHFRELRKLPGTLPPGFTLPAKPCTQSKASANTAVDRNQPGSFQQQPGSPLHTTRQSTAPELEVEPESISTGFEPEAIFPPERKKKSEPEGAVPIASVIESSMQNRFSRKPQTPRVETEAGRIEREAAEKQRQLTPEVRAAMAAAREAGKA